MYVAVTGSLRCGRHAVGVGTAMATLVALACFSSSLALAIDAPTAIFVMKLDGTQLRKLAQVEGFAKHGSPRWSHDGKRLAFDASDGPFNTAKSFVINADGTGLVEIGDLGMPDWSPDDKQLALSSFGGKQRAGTWVQNFDGQGRDWISAGLAPRWSPDGSLLAVTNFKSISILNLVDGGERSLLEQPFDDVTGGFDWSPDGKRIAFLGSHNKRRELWIASAEGAGKELTLRLTGSLNGYLAWSPDGKRLAISFNRLIQLIDADGKRPPDAIPGQEASNRMPAWSPDGQWIAFSSDRKSLAAPLKLAGKRTLELKEVTRHAKGSIVYGLAFTPDGRRVVMGGDPIQKGLQVWDIASNETKDYGIPGLFIAISPNGKQVATSGMSAEIQLLDVDSGEVTRELNHGHVAAALDFSKDGGRLLSGGVNKLLHIWDVNSGEKIATFNGHTEVVSRGMFSADGKEGISASLDKTVRIWNAKTGQERLKIEHPAPVWALALSPDGRQILTGTGGPLRGDPLALLMDPGEDNKLRLWDATTGKLIREMPGHDYASFLADISPDGRLAVTGGWDGTVRLWDLETGDQLSKVEGKSGVMSLAFSPDGRQVIVGGGVTRMANQRIVNIPDEQIRLYKLAEVANEPPPAGEAK